MHLEYPLSVLFLMASVSGGIQRNTQPAQLFLETGVLVGNSGGLTGHATGEIKLRVQQRLLRVFYQQPYRRVGFEKPECDRIGAIWRIQYHHRVVDPDTGIDLYLDSAECTGNTDSSIGQSNDVVLKFFDFVAHQDFLSAYRLLDPERRLAQDLESFTSDLTPYDFSQFLSFGLVIPCTEVKDSSPQTVDILAGPACFINEQKRPTAWEFRVSLKKDAWQIVSFYHR